MRGVYARAADTPSRWLDRFGLLVLVVIAAIVAMSLVDARASFARATLTHALSGAALLIAVRVAGVAIRWRRVADVCVGATVLVNATYAILNVLGHVDAQPGAGPELAWVVIAFAVPVVVARRLLQHTAVSQATLLGTVAAYLEIAVAFAIAFQSLDTLSLRPIFGDVVPTTSYMYVSLTTITTTGFGDVVPLTSLARLVTVSEAVIGQLFLVTFVAMIVSRFSARRPPSDDAPSASST